MSETDNHDEEVAWARDYVRRRIETCQWTVLLERLDGLNEPAESDGSFFGTMASSSASSIKSRFCGVLSLADPDTHRCVSKETVPPMPLTARNRHRLEAMGFVISACGRWAVYQEQQV